MTNDPSAVPRFAPGVRLRHDAVRDTRVLLAPERVFVPDPPALAILDLIDGRRTVAAVVAALVLRFEAPADRIAADVTLLLKQLTERGAVCWESNSAMP